MPPPPTTEEELHDENEQYGLQEHGSLPRTICSAACLACHAEAHYGFHRVLG
jgi:hypothetical protein